MRVFLFVSSCFIGASGAFLGCGAPSSGAGSDPVGATGGGSSSPDAGLVGGGGSVTGSAGGAGGVSVGSGGVPAGGASGATGGAPAGGASSGGAPAGDGGGPTVNPCGPVFKDCNADPADGCEANLQSDAANCGSCGAACTGAANASPLCFVGQCDYACNVGFGDCDLVGDNGCEVDLLTDSKNCGACRKDCAGKQCQNGGCQCASTSVTAEKSPLDIYVLFDQSGSMGGNVTGGTKWNVIKNALTTFVQSPAADGISVGIGYFPYVNPSAPSGCQTTADCTVNGQNFGTCNGLVIPFLGCLGCFCSLADACNVGSYTADVPIAILPGVSGAIVTSLGNHGPGGGTPTYPALQGAYSYATTWATAHPNEKTIVVLATDGNPTGCDGTLNNVNTIASNLVAPALSARPSIMTFVVGVGSSLTSLNQIAAAGGTQQAFIVDTAGADPGGQFLKAMQAITTSALLGCQYGIPNPPTGAPDFTKVNVQVTPASGAPSILSGVANQAACAGGAGWYYDNPAAPTQIILCDASCQSVAADVGANVQVLLGCGTNG